MPEEYLKKIVDPEQDANPLFNTIGIQVESIGPDRAVLTLPYSKGLLQGAGVIAGGVTALLLDEAMAHSVLAVLEPGQLTVTTNLSVRYLESAVAGSDLRAEARVTRKGGRLTFVRAEITDQHDRVIAEADGTFLMVAQKTDPAIPK